MSCIDSVGDENLQVVRDKVSAFLEVNSIDVKLNQIMIGEKK